LRGNIVREDFVFPKNNYFLKEYTGLHFLRIQEISNKIGGGKEAYFIINW